MHCRIFCKLEMFMSYIYPSCVGLHHMLPQIGFQVQLHIHKFTHMNSSSATSKLYTNKYKLRILCNKMVTKMYQKFFIYLLSILHPLIYLMVEDDGQTLLPYHCMRYQQTISLHIKNHPTLFGSELHVEEEKNYSYSFFLKIHQYNQKMSSPHKFFSLLMSIFEQQ